MIAFAASTMSLRFVLNTVWDTHWYFVFLKSPFKHSIYLYLGWLFWFWLNSE